MEKKTRNKILAFPQPFYVSPQVIVAVYGGETSFKWQEFLKDLQVNITLI